MSPHAPGFWLALSLISGVGVFYLEARLPRARWRALWASQRVLIPYLGLILGGLSPRLMGLTRLDWSASLGVGLVLMFGVTMLLILVRATVDLPDVEETRQRDPQPTGPARAAGSGATATPAGLRSLFGGFALAGVREFHWAFLRGGLWEMLLASSIQMESPAYWAVWGAAVVVLAELLARRLLFAHTIFQIVILVCTSILFLYTRNFWLCWILHTLAQWIVAPAPLRPALTRWVRRGA